MIDTETQREALRHEYGMVFEKLVAYRGSLVTGLEEYAKRSVPEKYTVQTKNIERVLEYVSDSFRELLKSHPKILDDFVLQSALALETQMEQDDLVDFDSDLVEIHTGMVGEEMLPDYLKSVENGLNGIQAKAIPAYVSLFTLRSDVLLGHIGEPHKPEVPEEYFLRPALDSLIQTCADLEVKIPEKWKFFLRAHKALEDSPSRIRGLRDHMNEGNETIRIGDSMELDIQTVSKNLEEYNPLLGMSPADFAASDTEFERRIRERGEELLKFLEQITQVYGHPIHFFRDIMGFEKRDELDSIIE